MLNRATTPLSIPKKLVKETMPSNPSSGSVSNASSGNRTTNASTASASDPGAVGNVSSGTGTSIGNVRSGSNFRPIISIPPPVNRPYLPTNYINPLHTPPSLKAKRAPKGALANILSLSNSNSENWSNARSNFNNKDDDEVTKAIAELIFANPDDEWSDVNFFVQTDIDKQEKDKCFL